MMELESMKYSLQNLWKRKSRSLITILSIFIGIATIFIFISFGMGLYSYVNYYAQAAGIDLFYVQPVSIGGVPGLDENFLITQQDLEAIQKTKGVSHAAGMYMDVIKVSDGKTQKYVFAAGYEATSQNTDFMFKSFGIKIYKGRDLKKEDRGKVALGYNYQVDKKIFENGLATGQKILINDEKFEIVGFYEQVGNPQDDSNVYMTDTDYFRLFPNKNTGFGAVFGIVDNVDNIDSIVESVEKSVRKSRGLEEGKEDFMVMSFEDLIEIYGTALNLVVGFIILIAFISVIVSAVNTANTMVTSVLERTREIGVMKAIGATRSTIRNIFLFESAVLGFIAGVLGVLFGWFASYIGGQILISTGWSFLAPKYTPTLFLGLIFFAVFVGTISGVLVAIQASRQNAVDALRYE